ncbi:MAG: EAL domain-containing protein [Gammaproteobacteria bacterium]|nr:EAL domain-containing protein [Gammaproteobacteria bacterium]
MHNRLLSPAFIAKSADDVLRSDRWIWLLPLVIAVGLWVASEVNFLLFHTLAELFAIAVAVTLSVVAWQMYPFTKNNYLMFLSAGYIWVAMLDLMHTLNYKGMGVFADGGANVGIQYWLSARLLEAMVLLFSPLFLTRNLNRRAVFLLGGMYFLLMVVMKEQGQFPLWFVEGEGLTSSKIYAEYLIIAILLAASMSLWVNKAKVENKIFSLLQASILLTVCAEVAFTFYADVYDYVNVGGHIFKFFSYWLIFVAFIRTVLQSPFLAMSRVASTYDAIPEVTLVVDREGIIRQANRKALEMAARLAGTTDVVGKKCHTLFHRVDVAEQQCPICKKIAKTMATDGLELPWHGGEEFYTYSLSPISEQSNYGGMIHGIRDISQRKKAEKLLRQSERYNRMLFEHSPIGLVLCDMAGKVVDANEAYVKITGYTLAELVRLDYWKLTPREYEDQEWDMFSKLAEKGRYGPVEKKYVHKTGRQVAVRLQGLLLRRDGQSFIWSSVEDISKQKQMENERSLFRLALDATEDNIFMIDPESMKFVDCNFSAMKMLCYSYEEILNMGPQDIKPDYSEQKIWDVFDVLISGQKEYVDLLTEHQRKDGIRFPVEVRMTCMNVRDESRIIAVARDVSDRAIAEQKLRQAAAVVDATAEGVAMVDAGKNILTLNKAFSAMTGFTEAELLGRSISMLCSQRHDEEFYCHIWRDISTNNPWQGELWLVTKQKQLLPTWCTVSAAGNGHDEITNYVVVIADITKLKQSQERVDFLAYHDSLTRLPNRLLLNDRLAQAIKSAKRTQSMVGVMFLDLDRFKNINDSLGHSVGDRLLEKVAERLFYSVRGEDTVARLGGDEFVLVIENCRAIDDLLTLSKKILEAFSSSFHIEQNVLFVTPSIGISVFPNDGDTPETLIRNADTAMYRAKEFGRNSCHLYSSDLTDVVYERLIMESELRKALDDNQFELYFQPQYRMHDNHLVGAEALIRWNHPLRGQVLPADFISLAEDCGLISRIGYWVLREACRQMRRWQDAGFCLPVVAVNVSGWQFTQGDIGLEVQAALAESGLSGASLELEITESVILKRPERAIETLNQLKTLGVQISIDDFGTGYSSLRQLRYLPVDKLKIDQSFIRDITTSQDDEAIARAVIVLAQNMRLRVIAEGVEQEAQRQFLLQYGCDEVQGYLYSEPLSASEFERQVLRRSAEQPEMV